MVFYCLKKKIEERDVALQLGCSVWLCIRGICGGKLSRRAQQISSWLALEEYLPFSPTVFQDVDALETQISLRWISCLWLQSFNISFRFRGNELSPSETTFITCPFSFCGATARIFSLLRSPGVLGFWVLWSILADNIWFVERWNTVQLYQT